MSPPLDERDDWTTHDLVTSRQVADYLHVHIRTVQAWARDGQIPSFRVGGRIRFRRIAVETFIEDREEGEESCE